MLKSYVPPGCPVHMFVRHYMRLQFARDSEESMKRNRPNLGDHREVQHGDRDACKHLVMKRRTRDSRDMLPPHLQLYQRDHSGSRTMTHCHTALYVHAMELVRLGDACVEAYKKGMTIFVSLFQFIQSSTFDQPVTFFQMCVDCSCKNCMKIRLLCGVVSVRVVGMYAQQELLV